jgi:electron transport complex protein RnfA
MASLFAIVTAVVIINHLVLARVPAIYPLPGTASRLHLPPAAWLITTLVLAAAVAVAWAADVRLLRALGLRELRLIALVLAIVVATPAGVLLAALLTPKRREILARYQPLITADCAMLGVALLVTRDNTTLAAAVAWAAATAIAFGAILGLFAELRARLEDADVPVRLRGVPIALVTAAIMSLAFSGLASVVRS